MPIGRRLGAILLLAILILLIAPSQVKAAYFQYPPYSGGYATHSEYQYPGPGEAFIGDADYHTQNGTIHVDALSFAVGCLCTGAASATAYLNQEIVTLAQSGTLTVSTNYHLKGSFGWAAIAAIGGAVTFSVSFTLTLEVWDTSTDQNIGQLVLLRQDHSATVSAIGLLAGTVDNGGTDYDDNYASGTVNVQVYAGHGYNIIIRAVAQTSVISVAAAGVATDADFHEAIGGYIQIQSLYLEYPTSVFFSSNAGSITFNGVTYTSGQSVAVPTGTYTAVANIPSGWYLYSWSGSGGVTPTDPNSPTTTVMVTGGGTLTLSLASQWRYCPRPNYCFERGEP